MAHMQFYTSIWLRFKIYYLNKVSPFIVADTDCRQSLEFFFEQG